MLYDYGKLVVDMKSLSQFLQIKISRRHILYLQNIKSIVNLYDG